jgi:inhibitor of the pro-sigma K processing machinery
MKYLIKLIYCTILGGSVLAVLNLVGDFFYFHIAFNVVNSIIIGILGIPGIALLVVLKVLFNVQ